MRFEVRDFRYNLFHVAAVFLLLLVSWSSFRFLRRTFGRFAGDFLYPYMTAAHAAGETLGDVSLLHMSKAELASQLERLLVENRRLAAQAAAAGELLVQNEMLRKMHGLKVAPGWRSIPAGILMRDAWFWNENLRIGKGSADGIIPGAAVVGADAGGGLVLVGVVKSCGKHSSEVATVYNPELKMSAHLPLSGATGILNYGSRHGSPDGRVPIGFMPQTLEYKSGEIVLTSGFERGIPSGIKIGVLEGVEAGGGVYSSELFLSGRVRPLPDTSKMRFLAVLVRPGEDDAGGEN